MSRHIARISLVILFAPVPAGAQYSATPAQLSWEFRSIGPTEVLASEALMLPSGDLLVIYDTAHDNDSAIRAADLHNGVWDTTLIDRVLPDGFAATILPTGQPAVAYYDEANQRLKYAWREAGAWNTEVVDATPYAGYSGCGIAVLPGGDPAISYTAYPVDVGILKFARRHNGQWTLTVVDSEPNPYTSVGTYSSMALQADGNPAISYSYFHTDPGGGNVDDRLRYAAFDGASWHIQDVEFHLAGRTSLAFGPAGNPAIAYVSNPVGTELRFAEFNGASWDDIALDMVGTFPGIEDWLSIPRLRMTSDGRPVMAYVRYENVAHFFIRVDLHIQERIGGQWVRTLIANTDIDHAEVYPGTPGFVMPRPGEYAVSFTNFQTDLVLATSLARGDLNCDGDIGVADAVHFAQALVDPAAYDADHDGDPFPSCNLRLGDLNGDGVRDGKDIQAFVQRVLMP